MKSLLIFFGLCYSSLTLAQTSSLPDSCNTVLWGVINTKGDTSYLLGTFHEFGNVYFDTYLPIAQKYKRANHIATESVPENLSFKRPRITTNWVKRLSKHDKQLINAYLKRTHSAYTLKFTRNLPPSLMCYALQQEMAIRECHIRNGQDVVGMDEYIMNGAITNKKKLTGLELPLDTFNVVNTMVGAKDNNDPAAITKLIDMVNNESKYLDTIRTECWEVNNYRNLTLNYHFSRSSIQHDANFAVFLDKRNDAWMPKVKEMIDNDKAFIAVGLKHLYYQKGLIMQLINSGYTVIPIQIHKIDKPNYIKSPSHATR